MAKIGFLSHSDLSVYYFRAPIMRALAARGHEVYAIIPKGAYSDRVANEFPTVIYELDKASLNPLRVGRDTKALADALRPLNLDLLQTAAHKSNVFGTFAARAAGVKHVLNLVEGLGSFYIHNDLKSRIIRFVIEQLYKKALSMGEACVFVNDSDPDYMVSKGLIAPGKVVRIKSVGVNASEFDPAKVAPEDLGLGDKKIVLMIGRALWDKGVREFYEAAELLSSRKDVRFVFVGEGYAGNPSSANEDFLKNPHVTWIRWSDRVKEILRAAYIYALPSYKEGFPRTVLEAMSMEVACVVSNCDGCVEAIEDGQTGLICAMRDATDLARKIEVLLDDSNLTRKMGKRAREVVLERYDEPKVVAQYLELYGRFIDV